MYIATILNPATKEYSEHRFPTEQSVYSMIEMLIDRGVFVMLVDIEEA